MSGVQFSRASAELAADTGIETDPVRAAAAALLTAPSPETFSTVCDALADLADEGELVDRVLFLDAVDRAQNLAMACGLVRTIGQDAVQAIMAQSFKRLAPGNGSPAS